MFDPQTQTGRCWENWVRVSLTLLLTLFPALLHHVCLSCISVCVQSWHYGWFHFYINSWIHLRNSDTPGNTVLLVNQVFIVNSQTKVVNRIKLTTERYREASLDVLNTMNRSWNVHCATLDNQTQLIILKLQIKLTIFPPRHLWCPAVARLVSLAGSRRSSQPTPPHPHTPYWVEQGIPRKCSLSVL